MLLGQEAVGRLPLDESMVTNTMLFEPRFCFGLVWFFFLTIHVLAFHSTIRFCYLIEIFNHFVGAKYKAT